MAQQTILQYRGRMAPADVMKISMSIHKRIRMFDQSYSGFLGFAEIDQVGSTILGSKHILSEIVKTSGDSFRFREWYPTTRTDVPFSDNAVLRILEDHQESDETLRSAVLPNLPHILMPQRQTILRYTGDRTFGRVMQECIEAHYRNYSSGFLGFAEIKVPDVTGLVMLGSPQILLNILEAQIAGGGQPEWSPSINKSQTFWTGEVVEILKRFDEHDPALRANVLEYSFLRNFLTLDIKS